MYLHVRGLGPVFLGALPMCTLQTCSKMMAFSDGVGSGGTHFLAMFISTREKNAFTPSPLDPQASPVTQIHFTAEQAALTPETSWLHLYFCC